MLVCVLLENLIRYVISPMENVLALNHIYCWSVSLDALYWIKRVNKNWDVFINNRVSKTHSVVDPSYWSHCPGKLSPADLPSRGILASKFNGKIFNLWCNGPEFLYNEKSDLPADKITFNEHVQLLVSK